MLHKEQSQLVGGFKQTWWKVSILFTKKISNCYDLPLFILVYSSKGYFVPALRIWKTAVILQVQLWFSKQPNYPNLRAKKMSHFSLDCNNTIRCTLGVMITFGKELPLEKKKEHQRPLWCFALRITDITTATVSQTENGEIHMNPRCTQHWSIFALLFWLWKVEGRGIKVWVHWELETKWRICWDYRGTTAIAPALLQTQPQIFSLSKSKGYSKPSGALVLQLLG